MALTTYAGLKAGVPAWMARSGDTTLEGHFDDFLLNCERRMYYGYATEDMGNPMRSEPIRIVEMEIVDPLFDLAGGTDVDAIDGVRITALSEVRVTEEFVLSQLVAATVAQPTGFLELISARLNDSDAPLEVVAQRTIDGYQIAGDGVPRMIAVSGLNFRVYPEPSGATYATLRYYAKLSTPTSGGTVNTILTNYPTVYLYGCLIEAAIYTQDIEAAQRYLQLYNADVAGLNTRTQRITASANPRLRLRGAAVI